MLVSSYAFELVQNWKFPHCTGRLPVTPWNSFYLSLIYSCTGFMKEALVRGVRLRFSCGLAAKRVVQTLRGARSS